MRHATIRFVHNTGLSVTKRRGARGTEPGRGWGMASPGDVMARYYRRHATLGGPRPGTHRSRRRGDRQGENRGRNAGRFHIWLAFSKYSVHVHSPDGNLPSRYVQRPRLLCLGP
jgi:hypothetical protein